MTIFKEFWHEYPIQLDICTNGLLLEKEALKRLC